MGIFAWSFRGEAGKPNAVSRLLFRTEECNVLRVSSERVSVLGFHHQTPLRGTFRLPCFPGQRVNASRGRGHRSCLSTFLSKVHRVGLPRSRILHGIAIDYVSSTHLS